MLSVQNETNRSPNIGLDCTNNGNYENSKNLPPLPPPLSPPPISQPRLINMGDERRVLKGSGNQPDNFEDQVKKSTLPHDERVNQEAENALNIIKASHKSWISIMIKTIDKSRPDLIYTGKRSRNTISPEDWNDNKRNAMGNRTSHRVLVKNYYDHLVAFINEAPVSAVFKYIASKMLRVDDFDQVCPVGLKPNYLDLRIKGKRVTNLFITKQLMDYVEITLSPLLRHTGFSALMNTSKYMHKQNFTSKILRLIGFSEDVNLMTVSLTIVIFITRYIYIKGIDVSPAIAFMEGVLDGNEVAELLNGINNSDDDPEEVVGKSLFAHMFSWKECAKRIDLLALLSWARKVSMCLKLEEKYEFISTILDELNNYQNKEINYERVIDCVSKFRSSFKDGGHIELVDSIADVDFDCKIQWLLLQFDLEGVTGFRESNKRRRVDVPESGCLTVKKRKDETAFENGEGENKETNLEHTNLINRKIEHSELEPKIKLKEGNWSSEEKNEKRKTEQKQGELIVLKSDDEEPEQVNSEIHELKNEIQEACNKESKEKHQNNLGKILKQTEREKEEGPICRKDYKKNSDIQLKNEPKFARENLPITNKITEQQNGELPITAVKKSVAVQGNKSTDKAKNIEWIKSSLESESTNFSHVPRQRFNYPELKFSNGFNGISKPAFKKIHFERPVDNHYRTYPGYYSNDKYSGYYENSLYRHPQNFRPPKSNYRARRRREYQFLPRGNGNVFTNPIPHKYYPPALEWCSYCGVAHVPGIHPFVNGELNPNTPTSKVMIYRKYDEEHRKTGRYKDY